MKKLFYFAFFLFGLIASNAVTPPPAYADTSCTPIYGGGVDCPPNVNVLIDKTVLNPKNNIYVDNLTVSDYRFGVNETVLYHVMVENTGNTTLTNVTVVDALPQYVAFVAGSGTYNSTTRELTITIPTLAASEKRTFDVRVRVVDTAGLPVNQTVTCVVNTARVQNGMVSDSDTAQVCIEKQVLGTPELPKSGPEHLVIALMGLATLSAVGYKLATIKS